MKPTPEELAIDVPHLLAACLERGRLGWTDLPMFADGPRTIAALCRRLLHAETVNAGLLAALTALRAMCIPGMNWTDEVGRQLLADADAAIAASKGGCP